MDRPTLRRHRARTADAVLAELTTHQFTRPHRVVADVLADVVGAVSTCPTAAARALTWLDLDPGTTIGRLTRSQLAQLANSLHRFGRQGSVVEGGSPCVAAASPGEV